MVKWILIIYFNPNYYVNIEKCINVEKCILSCIKSLCCIFSTERTSQFGVVIFQVLGSHWCWVATFLDSTGKVHRLPHSPDGMKAGKGTLVQLSQNQRQKNLLTQCRWEVWKDNFAIISHHLDCCICHRTVLHWSNYFLDVFIPCDKHSWKC